MSLPTLMTLMKAYANGSISRQYFFDTTYFHLLLGLRSRSSKSWLQQGLEIRGFLFQKKTVQRKTALLEAYTYVVKWFFFKKPCSFKAFVQNPRITSAFMNQYMCTRNRSEWTIHYSVCSRMRHDNTMGWNYFFYFLEEIFLLPAFSWDTFLILL